MTRPAGIALGLGVVGMAGVALLAFVAHAAVMPSYLAAWLLLLALPLGALPLVMAAELLGAQDAPLLPVLRRLVALMPLGAVLALPVLLRARHLYPALVAVHDGLPGWWMTPSLFIVRAIIFLLVWVALAFVFARPATSPATYERRRPLAGVGLALHLVMGTLAATDWALAVEPGFVSSSFGLLLLVTQSGLAASLAVTMAPPMVRTTAARELALVLAILLAVWGFLQFTQYLVVWSANLPQEVLWYRHRSAGLGQAGEYAAGILCLLALLSLVPRGLARRAGLVASVAAALLVMHAIEMFWLVTPAYRAEFSITLADILALAGSGGVGVGAAMILGERVLGRRRPGHGTT